MELPGLSLKLRGPMMLCAEQSVAKINRLPFGAFKGFY